MHLKLLLQNFYLFPKFSNIRIFLWQYFLIMLISSGHPSRYRYLINNNSVKRKGNRYSIIEKYWWYNVYTVCLIFYLLLKKNIIYTCITVLKSPVISIIIYYYKLGAGTSVANGKISKCFKVLHIYIMLDYIIIMLIFVINWYLFALLNLENITISISNKKKVVINIFRPSSSTKNKFNSKTTGRKCLISKTKLMYNFYVPSMQGRN